MRSVTYTLELLPAGLAWSGTHGSCTIVWLLPSSVPLPGFYADAPKALPSSTTLAQIFISQSLGDLNEVSIQGSALNQVNRRRIRDCRWAWVDREAETRHGMPDRENSRETVQMGSSPRRHDHGADASSSQRTGVLLGHQDPVVGNRQGPKKNHRNGEGHRLDSVKCISWESKLNTLEKKQDNQLQTLEQHP